MIQEKNLPEIKENANLCIKEPTNTWKNLPNTINFRALSWYKTVGGGRQIK